MKKTKQKIAAIILTSIITIVLLCMGMLYMGAIQIALFVIAVITSPFISVFLLEKILKTPVKIIISRIIVIALSFTIIITAGCVGKIRYTQSEAAEFAVKTVAQQRKLGADFDIQVQNYTVTEKGKENELTVVEVVLDYILTNKKTNESNRDVATVYIYYDWSMGEFYEDAYGNKME